MRFLCMAIMHMAIPLMPVPRVVIPCMAHDKLHETCMFYVVLRTYVCMQLSNTAAYTQLCGLSIGLAITRFQVQCPVPSVVVAAVSLSNELYSHCSSPPSCING